MNRVEILPWLVEHRLRYLATVEGGQPRVRVFGSVLISDGAMHFVTQKGKDVYNQLIANPKADLCFFDAEERLQVRVGGLASLVDDELHARVVCRSVIGLPGRSEAMTWLAS